jgi:endoglucanase
MKGTLRTTEAAMDFLRVAGGKIVDEGGRPVRLRGVNLGTWLLVEGYMLAGPNEPEHRIRGAFARERGPAAARKFFHDFQSAYIQEADLRRIKSWGFNVVRAPFNYRLFLDSPQGNFYARDGWKRLDWLAAACRRVGLYCILDLHAAPGAQNHDWHSDSAGPAGLWSSPRERARMADLWGRIAARYKNEPSIAGYDILNEPITDDMKTLNRLYRDCVSAVRAAGDDHIVFLEGPKYATDLEPLDVWDDPGLAYSVHFYEPHQFTFNWTMDLRYPGMVNGKKWDKTALREILDRHAAWAKKNKKPLLVGEFGVNSRCPCCHAEHRWLDDVLSIFNQHGFHWTYWSYKVVAGHMHPGGLLRYAADPAWVKREGVTIAWENYGKLTPAHRRESLAQFDSKYWTVDGSIVRRLKGSLK